MAHQRSVSALTNFLPLATSVRGCALGSTIARTFRRFALHALAVSLLALSAASTSFAANDMVTSLADDGSSGTLRSVIAAAAPGDTIAFSVSGTITLTSGTIVLNQNLTISGPGAANLAISGNNASTVFQVSSTASISGVTIENGNASACCYGGGGILNLGTLTLTNSTVSGNSSSSYAGGIANYGTMTLSNSTVSGNSAYYLGGGIFNEGSGMTVTNSTVSGNSVTNNAGGGISSNGPMTLSNSTVSGNSAPGGGGIQNYCCHMLTVTNTTVSGNSATYTGGGILNYPNATMTLSNSTVSGNSAPYGGGISNYPNTNGTMTVKNSIVANSPSGGNCYSGSGTITSQGYNLSDDASCLFAGTGDLNNTPAGLDPGGLQNNGGPTQTIAVLATSSAVDAIPTSVCSDASGNLVSTDQRGITRPQGSGCDIGAFELVQVPTANVCPAGQTTPAPCSYTITLQYDIPPGTTFGVNPVQVVTQGTPNLDFTLASTTCTGSPASCIVQVNFAPLAPGLRMGAVQLTDSSGNLLVTTMVHGVGEGPAIAFGPGVQTTVPASGLANPYCVALDGAGDVLIADPSNQRVVKVPAGGGPQTTVGSGLTSPFALAVDGAGDVFITDIGLNQVVEVPAGGGPQTTVGSGLSGPYSVAVDGAGDVFIADAFNHRVVEVPAGGGAQTTVVGDLYPFGVAVDGAGNLFVSDRNTNSVVKIPAGGGAQTKIVSGLNNPSGVAVDAAGNVFVADFDNNRALEVPAGGGPPTTVGSGLYDPFDMALDGAGNVFVVDWGNSRVVEVHRSQPPTLSFASTAVGSTSSDSPQSVTIQNIGNQPLHAVTPGLVVGGPNFLQVAGPGTPEDCTSSFALTPGATCNLSISFEPQSPGLLASTATFTDNALNTIPSASQSIALQGTGLAVKTATATAVVVYDAATGLPWSGTEVAGASSYASSTVVPRVGGGPPPTGTVSYTIYGNATCSGSGIGGSTEPLVSGAVPNSGTFGPLAAGSYSFSASYSGDTNYNSSTSTCATFSVSEAPTTTAVGSSVNPSTFGQSVTFTAAVTSTGGGTPTGTVTFTDGPNVLGVVALSGGQAALTTSSLGAGNHSIVASYSGDSADQASVSTALRQTVQIAGTTLGLASNINPSGYNQAVTFTAALTPQFGGSATGTVTFNDGVNTLGTAAVSGNLATITVSTLALGTHSITAVYSGDSNFKGSSSGIVSQVVTKASTTTAVASSLNPAFVTQTITYTATVTSQYHGVVSGSVVFKSGGVSFGSVTLVNGQASVNASYNTSATRSITATYVGDANDTGSTSAVLKQVVNKFTTSTNLTSSLNPSLVGQSVTFTATVSSAYGAIPDGEVVTFKDGTATLATVALSGGMATLNTSTLIAGTHSITVTYTGDKLFAASVSAAVKQVVNKNPSSTTVASSLNPSSFGQVVMFTATVTTGGSPTGTVTFKSGGATLGTVALTGNTASLSTSALAAGTHIITAIYSGDATFLASTSPGLKQVVSKALTSESLTSSQNPSGLGQPVTLTATVSSSSGVPTGTVTFKEGATTLWTAALSGGVATFTTSALAAGSNTITADYGGAANYSASSASMIQVVQ